MILLREGYIVHERRRKEKGPEGAGEGEEGREDRKGKGETVGCGRRQGRRKEGPKLRSTDRARLK